MNFGHGKRFQRGAVVWHRRAGKDSTALNMTAVDMMTRVGTYWHLFPEQAQARRAIWNGIDRQGRRIIDQVFPEALRKRTSSQEMLIELKNGSIWQMAGSDNYDSLVGSNPIGVVFSEWPLAVEESWEYIRPILVENDGWALFIYTPRGRNHGYSTFQNALSDDKWFAEKLGIDDTGIMTREQIDDEIRAGMSKAKARQEFDCSFEADQADQLISTADVIAARKRTVKQSEWDAKIMGVDVARFGDDKSVIYFRHGNNGQPIEASDGPKGYLVLDKVDTMTLAAKVAEWANRWRPDAIFVDVTGVGSGVIDRLRQMRFKNVFEISFGGKSDNEGDRKAADKRSEMWSAMGDWMKKGSIPDNDKLEFELTSPLYTYDKNNAIQLESKKDMRRRKVKSPDIADALALTFAYPIQSLADAEADYEDAYGASSVTGY